MVWSTLSVSSALALRNTFWKCRRLLSLVSVCPYPLIWSLQVWMSPSVNVCECFSYSHVASQWAHTHTHTHVHTQLHTHIHTHTYTHIHVHTQLHTHAVQANEHAHTHTCALLGQHSQALFFGTLSKLPVRSHECNMHIHTHTAFYFLLFPHTHHPDRRL